MPFFCPFFFPYFNTQLNEYDKNTIMEILMIKREIQNGSWLTNYACSVVALSYHSFVLSFLHNRNTQSSESIVVNIKTLTLLFRAFHSKWKAKNQYGKREYRMVSGSPIVLAHWLLWYAILLSFLPSIILHKVQSYRINSAQSARLPCIEAFPSPPLLCCRAALPSLSPVK